MQLPKLFLMLVLGASLFSSTVSWAQVAVPAPVASHIKVEDLRAHLEVLTADSLAGRATGEPGQQAAARYLARQFMRFGLLPAVPTGEGDSGYFQPFVLDRRTISSAFLRGGDSTFTQLEEVVAFQGNTEGEWVKTQLYFGGKGDSSALAQLDLRGKGVVIWGPERQRAQQARLAARSGASLVLLVGGEDRAAFARQRKFYRMYLKRPRTTLSRGSQPAMFLLPPERAAHLLGQPLSQLAALAASGQDLAQLPPQPVQFQLQASGEVLSTENVAAWLPGTQQPEEVLVITAHYDHLGKKNGKIYRGADDNGSGTAALLEVAQAFGEAWQVGKRPRRSVLFLSLSAEELGLFGSEYYADHDPLFPLSQTVANLNLDMVGHLDDAHPDNPRFVSIVGSNWRSSTLHAIHEQANAEHVQFELDYTYNDPNHPERFFYRSDQYNFAKHGIPVIFYTSGDHEDYHRPTDTIDRLSFERLLGVSRLVFYTAWEIVTRKESLQRDLDLMAR